MNRCFKKEEVQDENGPFKVAVSSVVYPVHREEEEKSVPDKKHRRIERFHSFVARNIRK